MDTSVDIASRADCLCPTFLNHMEVAPPAYHCAHCGHIMMGEWSYWYSIVLVGGSPPPAWVGFVVDARGAWWMPVCTPCANAAARSYRQRNTAAGLGALPTALHATAEPPLRGPLSSSPVPSPSLTRERLPTPADREGWAALDAALEEEEVW